MRSTDNSTQRIKVNRGRLSIPVSFPEESTVTVEQIGTTFVIFPTSKATPTLTAMLEFRREAAAADVSLKDLLVGIDQERPATYRALYGGR